MIIELDSIMVFSISALLYTATKGQRMQFRKVQCANPAGSDVSSPAVTVPLWEDRTQFSIKKQLWMEDKSTSSSFEQILTHSHVGLEPAVKINTDYLHLLLFLINVCISSSVSDRVFVENTVFHKWQIDSTLNHWRITCLESRDSLQSYP